MDLSGLDQLTSIGAEAFKGCSALAFVNLDGAGSVVSIGSAAFSHCTALREIKAAHLHSLQSIGDHESDTTPHSRACLGVFFRCSALTSIVLSDTIKLKIIGDGTFAECGSLQELHLSPATSLQIVGDDAFQGCESLQRVLLDGLCGQEQLRYDGSSIMDLCGGPSQSNSEELELPAAEQTTEPS